MDTPGHRFLPREGFYIDPIAKLLRSTILNPWLTVPIACALQWKQLANSLPLPHRLIGQHHLGAIFAILSSLGLALATNDFLTLQFHNNWVKDESWDWDKEIVLITGGSSGIGASVAQQLFERNKRTTVVILDYSLLAFQPKAGAKILYYRCDLSNSSEIKSVCAKIRKEVGDPTVVFNNAGLTRGATIMEGMYADVEVTFRTNIIAPFLILKEFLPAMVSRNHGHILGASSMSSIITPAGLADYGATKAGLFVMHEALAQELKNKHNAPKVRLSLATLSFVATPMFKGQTNQRNFLTPLMHVDTVGEMIVDVLYSGYGRHIYLPGIMRYVSCVQSWPSWIKRIMANDTEKLRVDYVGRQRVDAVTGNLK